MDPNSTLAGPPFAVAAMNHYLNLSNYEWSGLEHDRFIVPRFSTLSEELYVGNVHSDVKYTDEADTAEVLASLAVEVCIVFALVLVHILGIKVASKFARVFVRTKSMYHFTLCRKRQNYSM